MAIYKITGYGDWSYYSTLEDAQAEVRAIDTDYVDTTLKVIGALIKDEHGGTVGEVLNEAAVPARDRWQFASAAVQTPEKNPHAVHRGRLGGLAAAAGLTPDERKARAARAGKKAPGWPKGKPRGPRTNWGGKLP